MQDAVRHTVGHARHHHAAVGVADQDDAHEFLGRDETRDVEYVRVRRDLLGQEVGALPKAGQRRDPYTVTKHP